jgi:hypothetical protein
LADHAQACYGGSAGKSMKAVELRYLIRIVGVTSPSHTYQVVGENAIYNT